MTWHLASGLRSDRSSPLPFLRCRSPRPTSALVRNPDSSRTSREVRNVPIVLKKSFLGDERNFLGPLMRFVRGDVRDHIVSNKSDHGPSYQRYGALQL